MKDDDDHTRARSVSGKPGFELIVARHGPAVLRVCSAVVGRADADEAWAETFLAAMRAYPELPSDANVEAWLVTIARRKAIDAVRARDRRAVPVGVVPDVATNDEHRSDVNPMLLDALANLPVKQRQAVTYHYLADLPYADIAGLLGGTADAARRAAADGMAKLRRTFADTTWKDALK